MNSDTRPNRLRHGRHARPSRAAAVARRCLAHWRPAVTVLGAAAILGLTVAATALIVRQDPTTARFPVPPAPAPAAYPNSTPETEADSGDAGDWSRPGRIAPLHARQASRPRPRPPAATDPAPRPAVPPRPVPRPTPTPTPSPPEATPKPRPGITIIIPLRTHR